MRSSPGYVSRWYSSNDVLTIAEVLCIGDRLEFNRGVYKHWAICVTAGIDAHVIHRTGDSSDYLSASFTSNGRCVGQICLETLLSVLSNYKVRINNSLDRNKRPRMEQAIVCSAVCAIDNEKEHGTYHLMHNNCEHFVNWCRYDSPSSKQVRVANAIGAVLLGTLSTIALRLLRS